MNVTRYVAVTLGLFSVAFMLLQVNAYLTGSWDTVAATVSEYLIILWAFGLSVAALYTYGRRR